MKLGWSIVAVIGLFVVAASAQVSALGASNGSNGQSVTSPPEPQAVGVSDVLTTSVSLSSDALTSILRPAAPSTVSYSCSTLSDAQGSITTTNPIEAGRLFRDANPTLCSMRKSFPGLNDSNPRHFSAHWFTNSSGVDRCYAVAVNQACTGTHMTFFTTYLNNFNPADLGANYLADIGSSPIPTGAYSFTVPAGANFGIVVNEVTPNAGCNGYAFTLKECSCWSTSATGSITNTDSTQTGRLFRDAVASTCPISKTFPGLLGSDTIHYDKHDFANTTSTTACYKVDVSAPNCTGNHMIFVSAYLSPYDPGNLATNYLADLGASPTPFGSFSFKVPAGRAYALVVNEVMAGAGCSGYKLDINSCASQVCLPMVKR